MSDRDPNRESRDSGIGGDQTFREEPEPNDNAPLHVIQDVIEEEEEEENVPPLPILNNAMADAAAALQQALARIDALEAAAQPARVGAVSGSQLQALPEFDGATGRDIDVWIWNVERCRRQFGWTDATTSASAQGRMKEAAAYWLHAKKLSGVEFNHWDDPAGAGIVNLRPALLERFKIRINALVAADAVTNLVQKRTEAVSDFYDRVVVAVDRKNFSYTAAQKAEADYQEKMLQDVFVFFHAGLLPAIKSRATNGAEQPTDAAALLAAAIQAELFLSKQNRSQHVDEVQEVRRGGGGNSSNAGKKPMSSIKCFNCNQYAGHFARECPKPQRQRNSAGGSKGSPKKSPAKPVFQIDDENGGDNRAENEDGGYQ